MGFPGLEFIMNKNVRNKKKKKIQHTVDRAKKILLKNTEEARRKNGKLHNR